MQRNWLLAGCLLSFVGMALAQMLVLQWNPPFNGIQVFVSWKPGTLDVCTVDAPTLPWLACDKACETQLRWLQRDRFSNEATEQQQSFFSSIQGPCRKYARPRRLQRADVYPQRLFSLSPPSKSFSLDTLLVPRPPLPRQRLRPVRLHLGIVSVDLPETPRAEKLRLVLCAVGFALPTPQGGVLRADATPRGRRTRLVPSRLPPSPRRRCPPRALAARI